MAEEEVVAVAVAVASPQPLDHKRKHEQLEPEAPEPPMDANANEHESDSVKRTESAEEEEQKEAVAGGDSDESEAKRPRLEENDGLVTDNGLQEEVDEPVEENAEQPSAENTLESEDPQLPAEEVLETENIEQPASEPASDDLQTGDIQPPPSVENTLLKNSQQQPSGGELQEPSAEVPQQGDISSVEEQSASETQTMSRKMEVPNNKVGVLIGKSGETIRFLQLNSGAKIQITRDADADPYSTTRHVELIGSLESINKAERLIKDVIAEADAGGSPSLVAKGFNTILAAGAAEQILIQVPNEKVGLIIGKGGETIKNLQTRSGARIQLTPQHLPEGDQSKERTVRVSGDKKQIEMAREMIKEVMNQPARPSSLSGGYNQHQGYRPRGPTQPQWGSRGTHPSQPTGYDYQQRGSYPSQNSQYPPQAYGNYASQQVAPRSSYGSGWDQRPPSAMQGHTPPSGVYDYYGGQGHMVDAPTSNPVHAHGGHGPSPTPMGPPSQGGNYNYGQPVPYSQTAPPPQSYAHGYNETKYENQAPSHYPYGGGHGGSQQGGYPQGGTTYPGYAPPQDQYGKPSFGVPPHGPPSQQYGQPRASQPGDNIPYQGGPISSAQPYGQNAPPQQTYPQTYPPYGSAPASDGYNQLPPATGSAPVYPQQGGPPVSGYGQPGGQQALGYAQAGPTGGYGSYPSSQLGYTEPPAQNNAGYGYQGAVDPAYGAAPGSAYGGGAPAGSGYGAPPAGQGAYAQAAPTQAGYDQSVPHSGGYGSVPVGAPPVGYGKSLSPQPGYAQYDTTQMLGGHR